MGADDTLNVFIQSVLDAKGFADLQQRLQQAQADTKTASAATNEFSQTLEGLGTKLLAVGAGALSVGAALSFLKEAIHDGIEESRVLDQMRAANESLAGATMESRDANEAWLVSVERASGKTKEELVPSYVRLVAVTGNVAEAHRITEIAAGAAARGFGDLGQITQALIRYYETGQTQTRGFGAVIKSLVGDAKDVTGGFDKLNAKFGDSGVEMDNLGIKVDRLKTRWHDLKAEIGNFLASRADDFIEANRAALIAIGLLDDVKAHSRGAADAMYADDQKIEVGRKEAVLTLKEFTEQYDTWAVSAKNASKSVIDGLRGELAVYRQMAADPDVQAQMSDAERTKLAAKIIALERNLTVEIQSNARKRADAVREQYDEEVKLANISAVSKYAALNAEIAIYKRMATDPAVLRKAQIDAAEKAKQKEKELNDEIERGNQKVLLGGRTLVQFLKDFDDEQDKELLKAQQTADKKLKLLDENFKKAHSLDNNYLQEYDAFLANQLATFAGTEEEKSRIFAEQTRVRKELAKQEVQVAMQVGQALVGLAGQVFGQTKEVAYAQAIINIAQGITAALGAAPPPYNIVLAAITAAAGLVQLEQIASAEPGGGTSKPVAGFDDPQNDFAAVAGGRKWARDMIQFYGQGAAAGFSEGMMRGGGGSSSSVAYNTSNRGGDRTINFHFNGVFTADRVAMAKLVRDEIAPHLYRYDKRRELR